MIARLEGVIKMKAERFLVLDVSGVGYKVFVPKDTLLEIPKTGEKFSLWTHLHVREGIMDLYGFLNYAELQFFEELIQISGIGPKSGLAVLSVAPLDTLKRAIASGETTYLTKVSGIGNKLASKIVLELKEKMASASSEFNDGAFQEEGEALDALRSMGYSFKEGREALQKIPKGTRGTGNILKEALKNMHRK